MKRALSILFAAAAFSAVPAAAAPKLDGEAQLQRELEGRVAGEPVQCIDLRRARNSRVIEGTAIVFGEGARIYVNRPEVGRESLRHWYAMVTRPFDSRLCDVDVVRMVDLTTGIEGGSVFLGDFVPYTRVRN